MSQAPDLLENVLPYLRTAVARARQLPLFTLAISVCMTAFLLLSVVSSINVAFSLKPSDIANFEFSRLTTYPLVHSSMIQFLMSIACFIPLCSRYEHQYGTLRTLAMFLGPFESVPGLLYCLFDGFVLRRDGIVMGCSGFVFTMIAAEAMQYSTQVTPEIVLGGRRIPTLAVPPLVLVFTTIFLPGGSILLHTGSIAIGLIFGSGRVDFLLLPLRVVNLVESKASVIVDSIPGYITAQGATAAYIGLPNSIDLESAVSDQASPRSAGRRESGTTPRPAAARQVSSKWPAGQRED